ncbi:RNA-processing protein, partial [Candidatus Woesearchaeota archaeon CG10_big_fil_rev_8_21_14_0_10_47_5]
FVNAIGRGFNPRVALHLLRGDYVCEVISLRGRSSKSRKFLERMKGRIIGSQGKSRRLMEELSGTNICVYGKTVSIIGLSERVAITRKAIEMLLKGSQHSTVYRWLEKEGCRLRRKQFLGQFGIEEGNI